MKKGKILLFAILNSVLPLSVFAQPVCPVCTVAVGAGVGLCRYLGIDDLISGTWVGGLMVSLTMWTLKWLDKKNIRFKFRRLVVAFLFYFLIIAPLYWIGIMGQLSNKFLGIDKLLFGIIVGSIFFIAALMVENFLRKKNQSKAYFPFQKVVIPVSFLIIASLIFNFFC